MRRRLVRHGKGCFRLPLGLALQKEGGAAGKAFDLALLPGDDVGHVLDRARQMRESFLDFSEPIHGAPLAWAIRLCQRQCLPPSAP